jgi:hypothetical protein
MTIKSNFPSIRPSLNLDFANTRALDPRITFTRTTTATYYDGKTTAKAEENLLLRSQEFDDAGWTKVSSTVTANSTVAPDGTSTADKLEETATTDAHFLSQGNWPTTTLNTFSVFMKADEKSYGYLRQGGGSNRNAFFDLTNGVVGTVSAGWSASIVSVGNGWYRCIVTQTTLASAASGIIIGVASADDTRTYAGVAGEGIFLWGAQLEQRSAVTAYTPTTTAPITNYIPALQTAASGVARFDHNPITGESLGLLVEEQRTNLLTYSDDFSDAAWTKTRSSITANTIVAPDGTLTGDKLVEDTTASNTHVVAQSVSYTSGTNYSFSLFAKAAERTSLSVQFPSGQFGASVTCSFNLSAGTVTVAISGTGTSATITAVGNGWYRCVAISQATSSGTANTPILLENTPNNRVYTGNGYSGLYIWGAQVEAAAFPTSYIPTVAATVTRNADAASMTGANVTSWFSNAQGTLYAEVNPRALAVTSGFQINDNTTSNRIRLATTSTSDQGTITTSGTAQATLDGGTPAANTSMKLAMSYAVNDFKLSLNGGTAATDTAGTVPVVNQLQIGAETTTIGNMTLKKIAYYPIAVTAAELQALTTI